jgi:hypothetical protein
VLADSDGDGQPDDPAHVPDVSPTDGLKADSDGDGVCDGPSAPANGGCRPGPDVFPLDPTEWADPDADYVGSNADPDDDGDGLLDDDEPPPMNPLSPDTDGDGVCDGPAAVHNAIGKCLAGPDAFPLDPSEFEDTDGDGVGDNEDPDDDGDGRSDVDELSGKPPCEPTEAVPVPCDPKVPDTDGDGVCDGPNSVDYKVFCVGDGSDITVAGQVEDNGEEDEDDLDWLWLLLLLLLLLCCLCCCCFLCWKRRKKEKEVVVGGADDGITLTVGPQGAATDNNSTAFGADDDIVLNVGPQGGRARGLSRGIRRKSTTTRVDPFGVDLTNDDENVTGQEIAQGSSLQQSAVI